MAAGSVSPKTGKILDIPTNAPTIGTATDLVTGGNVTVAFTAGSTAVGGPVYNFTATSTPSSITSIGTSSPITVSGLTVGTSYTFTVKANNPSGSSALSAASNAVTPAATPTNFESIATASGTGSSGTITFSSISGAYKTLQIRIHALGASGAENAGLYMRFNSDSGSNYSRHLLYGDGTSAGQTGSGSTTEISLNGYGSTLSAAGNPTVGVINIVDYASTTKKKTSRSVVGTDKNNAYAQGIDVWSGNWNDTSAITSISIIGASVNFATTTTISLYGIKGA